MTQVSSILPSSRKYKLKVQKYKDLFDFVNSKKRKFDSFQRDFSTEMAIQINIPKMAVQLGSSNNNLKKRVFQSNTLT